MTDKNKFPMPMIKSAEYAAEKMFVGLTKQNVFEIHFPKTLTMIMKLLKIIPNWLFFLIVGRGIKKIKYQPFSCDNFFRPILYIHPQLGKNRIDFYLHKRCLLQLQEANTYTILKSLKDKLQFLYHTYVSIRWL